MAGQSTENLVDTRTLSEAFGVSMRRVQQLASEGIIENKGSARANKFDWVDSTNRYIAYLLKQQKEVPESDAAIERKKAKADAEYKEAKAAQEKLELAEMAGNMHRSEDVRDAFEQFAYGVRSMLMALPGRAAMNVMNAANAAEAADVIREQVNEILVAITQFYYDPEFFKERVKDRKGWRAVIDEFSGSEGSESEQGV